MSDTLTVDLTPDYPSVHRTFLREAGLAVGKLVRAAQAADSHTAYNTMRSIHNVMIALNLALASATTVEEVQAVREVLHKITEATRLELQVRERRLPEEPQ